MKARKVCLRMGAFAIAREIIDCRRRIGAAEGPVIAHIGPKPGGDGFAFGQERHSGVVAMDAGGSEDVVFDQAIERRERQRGGAHMIGQSRNAEIDAGAGKFARLPVQRLMQRIFVIEQHGQERCADMAAGDDMKRRRRLADFFAIPAGEFLSHGLDDLEAAGDRFERLGDVFAQFGQSRRAAAGALRGRRHDDPLARQLRRKRLF